MAVKRKREGGGNGAGKAQQVTLSTSIQRGGEFRSRRSGVQVQAPRKAIWSNHPVITDPSHPKDAHASKLTHARDCALSQPLSRIPPFASIASLVDSLGSRRSSLNRNGKADSWSHFDAYELALTLLSRNCPSRCDGTGTNAQLVTSLQAWAPTNVKKRANASKSGADRSCIADDDDDGDAVGGSQDANPDDSSQFRRRTDELGNCSEEDVLLTVADRALQKCEDRLRGADMHGASSKNLQRNRNRSSVRISSSGSDTAAHGSTRTMMNNSDTDSGPAEPAGDDASAEQESSAAECEGALLCFAIYLNTLSSDAEARLRIFNERKDTMSENDARDVLLPMLRGSILASVIVERTERDNPATFLLECILALIAQNRSPQPAHSEGTELPASKERVERARSVAAREAKRLLQLYARYVRSLQPFEYVNFDPLAHAWIRLRPREQWCSLGNLGSIDLKGGLLVELGKLIGQRTGVPKKNQLCMDRSGCGLSNSINWMVCIIGGDNAHACTGGQGSPTAGINKMQDERGSQAALQAAATASVHAALVYTNVSDDSFEEMTTKVQRLKETVEKEEERVSAEKASGKLVDSCINSLEKMAKMMSAEAKRKRGSEAEEEQA